MPTTIQNHRHHAYVTQKGRCFYCDLPMWEDAPEAYANTYGLTPGQAAQFKCTAEHLLARQDGGKDTSKNVVAACLCCNSRRHRCKAIALAPEKHKALVQQRLQRGRWVERSVAAKLMA